MSEIRSSPERRSRERTLNPQRVLGWLLVTATLCLALVTAGYLSTRQRSQVPAGLVLTRDQVQFDRKTGKLVWSGTVANQSSTEQAAPWVFVTLYDPEGDSVDSGEAMSTTSRIPAGGKLDYSAQFDSRGDNMRARSRLELPNSRPLGM